MHLTNLLEMMGGWCLRLSHWSPQDCRRQKMMRDSCHQMSVRHGFPRGRGRLSQVCQMCLRRKVHHHKSHCSLLRSRCRFCCSRLHPPSAPQRLLQCRCHKYLNLARNRQGLFEFGGGLFLNKDRSDRRNDCRLSAEI